MLRLLSSVVLAALVGLASAGTAAAADYAVSPSYRSQPSVAYIDRGPNPYCGPRCGCPTVVHVRHRSLVRFYTSTTFDPRTRDEPYYAYGPVRTYARYANAACLEKVMQY
jgi:hypothetical protein